MTRSPSSGPPLAGGGVGRKMGFTNRTIWPRYSVHEPIWGRVYNHTLIEAEANDARVPLAGLINPRLEPEVWLRAERGATRVSGGGSRDGTARAPAAQPTALSRRRRPPTGGQS